MDFFRDTAGLKCFRFMIPLYCQKASGIFFFYNISNHETFEHISEWLDIINKYCDTNVVKYLIGNEVDSSSNREVTYDKGKEFADKRGLLFAETSPIT